LVGCGSDGALSTNSACNVLSTMPEPLGEDASNGNCLSNDSITACDPNAFTAGCMGDFLAIGCMPFGQAKGYDCTASTLGGTCVLDGPPIGGDSFCEVGEGKPCTGQNVRCAEGSSCSLSGTCISDTPPDGDDDDEDDDDEGKDDGTSDSDDASSEAEDGCGCNQTKTHSGNGLWLGFIGLFFFRWRRRGATPA
jgi:hypothetical protein